MSALARIGSTRAFGNSQGLGFGVSLAYAPRVTTGPTPGAALSVVSTTPLPKTTYSLPGLGSSPAATVFLVFDKLTTAEQQHVISSIYTADGVYHSLLYAGRNDNNFGFGLNTYVAAADALPGYPLDNQKLVLIRAKMYNPGPGQGATPFSMALNGVDQALVRQGAQVSRNWTNTFTLGGFLPGGPPLDWQGNKYAALVYLSDLSEADCQRTEAYLRGLYPAVN